MNSTGAEVSVTKVMDREMEDNRPTQRLEKTHLDLFREAEQRALVQLNDISYERQRAEWMAQRIDQLSLRDVWKRCQRTVSSLWVDLFVHKQSMRTALLEKPQRWAPLGLVLLLLSFLLYVLDVLESN